MISVVTWLLLVQGTGPSASAINTVREYTTLTACEADALKIRNTFWSKTLCLQSELRDR